MYDTLIIEPTLQCNLRCPMCDRALALRETSQNSLMPLNFSLLRSKLPKLPKLVYITGGEPTLYKNLSHLCGEFLQKNISISVQTNGTRPEVISNLINSGVAHFNISVDGPPQIHDHIRGEGVYEKVLSSMRLIRDSGCRFVTTTVICDLNIPFLSLIFSAFKKNNLRPQMMIFELARLFDANIINESARIAGTTESQVSLNASKFRNFDTSLKVLQKNLEKIQVRSKSYRQKAIFFPSNLLNDIRTRYEFKYRHGNRCQCSHREILRIDPYGNVIPCFSFRKSFGNLMHDSWSSIMKNADLFWSRMERNNFTPVCDNCFRLEKTIEMN